MEIEILILATNNTFFIIIGFCFCFYMVFRYLMHLDILRKAESVTEYANREVLINNEKPEPEVFTESKYKDITDVSADEAFAPR